MEHYNYQETFKILYDKAVKSYADGNHDKNSYYDEVELAFIQANGWRVQDFYDYGEDWVLSEQPSNEIAQSIEQVRREYFLHVQNGKASANTISAESLPAKSASVNGIEWLPRILPKARGKLRGELPEETMYCCGGDRDFLRTHNIHPAEFLRVVWANMENDEGVIEFVEKRSPSSPALDGPCRLRACTSIRKV